MAYGGPGRHVVLTGPPGIGKTTIVQKVCQTLKAAGIPVQGFYTEELRAQGRRVGFDVVTLQGQRAPLARVGSSGKYRVGQYVVTLQEFEQVALLTLNSKTSSKPSIFVIDEIGKMEMFSEKFKQIVLTLLNLPFTTVLTTIPIAKGRPIPFVEDIRQRNDSMLFTISKENRDTIHDDIFSKIHEFYQKHL